MMARQGFVQYPSRGKPGTKLFLVNKNDGEAGICVMPPRGKPGTKLFLVNKNDGEAGICAIPL